MILRRPSPPLSALGLGFLVTLAAHGAVSVQETRPARGPAGTRVAILGKGLQEVTGVTLGGAAAPFTPKDGYLLATVPNGAPSGAILATGRKGELHLATDAGHLDLELLDGLKTLRLLLPVQRR